MAAIDRSGLLECKDHWKLPLDGRVVARILVDHAITLQFLSPGVEYDLRIEGVIELRGSAGMEWRILPQEAVSLGPLLGLLHKTVESAKAYKNGLLEVFFAEGSFFRVGLDLRYEAWEIVGGNLRVVSIPGGDLAIWVPTVPS